MQELLQIGNVIFKFQGKDTYTITETPTVVEADLASGGKFVEIVKAKNTHISATYESELLEDVSHLEAVLKNIPCTVLMLDTQTEMVITKQMKYTSISKIMKFHKRNTSCWGLQFELEEI